MIELTALAQAHFGDWIETIIVVAIILGSVFQGLGKAIIKKLTEMKEADALERCDPADPQPASRERRPPAAQPRPNRPVASPFPNRPETSKRPSPSPMQAPRPIARPVFDTPSVPSPTDAPRPVARRAAPRAKPQPTRRANAGGLRAHKPHDMPAPKPAPKHRFKKKHESVAEHHLQLSDEVAHPSTESAYHEPPQVRARLPKLTRSTLRDAVILREVLGPPVALRDPRDGF